MKQERINELNEINAKKGVEYPIKYNTPKAILKRFILSDLFIKVFVYTSAFILCLLLTLDI